MASSEEVHGIIICKSKELDTRRRNPRKSCAVWMKGSPTALSFPHQVHNLTCKNMGCCLLFQPQAAFSSQDFLGLKLCSLYLVIPHKTLPQVHFTFTVTPGKKSHISITDLRNNHILLLALALVLHNYLWLPLAQYRKGQWTVSLWPGFPDYSSFSRPLYSSVSFPDWKVLAQPSMFRKSIHESTENFIRVSLHKRNTETSELDPVTLMCEIWKQNQWNCL